MGYASPFEAIGYNGLVASDTTLQKDTTEYSTTSTSGETKLTGTWIEDVSTGSTIRFKADLKKAGGGTTYVYLYMGGSLVATFSEVNVAYQSHSVDIDITWDRTDAMSIVLKSTVAGTAYVKNVEFCGDKSPIIID